MKRYIRSDIKDAKDESIYTRREMAKNPNARPRTLDQLARDVKESVRKCVAENKNTSPETLDYLSKDKSADVRYCVAKNPNTTAATLSKLLDRSNINDIARFDGYMISLIIAHPNTSLDMFEKIATSPNVDVRDDLVDSWAIEHGVRIPDVILKQLSKDPDEWVRCNTFTYLDSLKLLTEPQLIEWANDESSMVRRVVAQHPKLPANILTKLSKSQDENTRASVAGNESTPIKVLETLANDDSDWVCRRVATNPSTPIEVLKKLAEDTRFHPARNVAGLARQMLRERTSY